MSPRRFLATALLSALGLAGFAVAAPPSNDDCAGAVVIPDGPYPLLSPAVDGAEATPQGVDEGLFPCAVPPDSGVDFTVWYSFTPSVTAAYTFTTCPAAGGIAATVLDTVLGVFASTGGSCPAAANVACNDSAGCATNGDYATVNTVLTGGETYFVVIGNWQPGGPIGGANTTYQVLVDSSVIVANDTCAGAVSVPLDRVVAGTSTGAGDDYRSPATTACFAGIGQTPTTSAGRDIVFRFTAPATDTYSIRYVPVEANTSTVGENATLYASSTCPSEGGTVSCLAGGGANRESLPAQGSPTGIANNRGEEIHCLPLTAGEPIYVFYDNATAGNAGGLVGVEVTLCRDEIEPNNTTATATPYASLVCGNNEGSSTTGATAHCVLGAMPGAPCIIRTGTGNVNSDCGASPGLCFTDSICIGGATPGNACVPTCTGGPTPGLTCTVSSQCGVGGTCATNGSCGACVGGPTPGIACTAAAQCGAGGTCNAGLCDRRHNEGDVDFWNLGGPPAGSKIFAAIEAAQANDFDWRMRVTSSTETLGFDDDDGTSMSGTLAPVIAGAAATGGDTFARVSRTTGWASQPYRLYAVTQPPIASAQTEPGGDAPDNLYGWPGDGLFAPYMSNGAATGYIRGMFAAAGDMDCWQSLANEGDDLIFFGDSNPARAEGVTPGIPQLILYDAASAAISNFVFNTGTARVTGPQTGNTGLEALTPQNTSFFMHWRARYTGAFEICAYPSAGTFPAPGPYPKSYAGSVSVNCQPPRPAGPGTTTTDVSVSKTGPSGNVPTSTMFDYVITVTNSAADIAQGVHLVDTLPANLIFAGLVIDDGFGGANTACLSLPTPLTNDAPIDCTNISMAPGSTTTYTVTVQVENCSAGGVLTENTASITTISTDPNPANDSATTSFTTEANLGCTYLECDGQGCFDSACIVNDHCSGSVCEAEPQNCDDNSICTDDTCDPRVGCINEPGPNDHCDIFNPCTPGHCDPIDGCVFPPGPPGVPCNDFNSCTTNDVCDGAGECIGTEPAGPDEVGVALVDKSGTDAVIVWPAAVNADSYDVLLGSLAALPVGPGGGDESCLATGVAGTSVTDTLIPSPGTGVWYVIRGANACAAGSYGSGRTSTTCP